jgi:hypothetical protein
MELCMCKETILMNNLPHQKFFFCFKVMKFRLDDTYIFGNTLCYYNIDDYDILRLQMFFN